MKRILHLCLTITVLISCFNITFGQKRWIIPRLSSGIVFDGVPDDPAWEKVTPFPMIMHIPTFGLEPGERSDVRLTYDDQYVYLGAILYVSDPSMIQALGKKRDLFSMNCDWIGISMDTYNDKETSLLFFTNPNGLRWDGTISNDGTPVGMTEPLNINWNTFWDVKTGMGDGNWTMEMRIPISSLRFQEAEGKVIMGVSIFRWVPAINEGYVYPAIPYNWGGYSNLKPSQYAEVEFAGLSPRKPLYISPYILSGLEQAHDLNSNESAYDFSRDFRFEPGLDIKYGINPNTVLDLTLNTDFADVEADEQQFNLSRFSLVFPEKRNFFLERSSIFDFGLGGPNTLFYSRRIGLYEDEPVRIWGGARLNSRIKDWDIGFLDLQTASLEDLPSENFGVFRAKRRVLNDYSYTGGMLTSRVGVDGTYNMAYGLDGVIRMFGEDYLTVRWAQAFTDTTANNPLSLDQVRFMINWQNRRQDGFTYSILHTRSGIAFEPGIGFEIFQDYFATMIRLKYAWISPVESPLQDHYLSLITYHLNDVTTNELLTYFTTAGWTFNGKESWYGSFDLTYEWQYLSEEFELLDPVVVPVGKYSFLSANFMLNSPGSRPLSATLMFEGGTYYDGLKISPSIQPVWNLGASVELGGMYRLDWVDFPDRSQRLINHIAGLRALYMFSTKISFSAFIQYNSAIDKIISNVKFRYNPREGTDLYLVFNEGRNTYLDREVPTLPLYDHRSITLKLTYTFNL